MYYTKRKPKTAKEKAPKPKRPSTASLIRKLDKTFSLFVRLRDSRPFGYKHFRCISCGRILPFDRADCGHFIGRMHMATRFDEQNCSCECRSCNRFSPDHMIYYQRNLERKIGKDRMEMLIARGHGTKKWTAWELQILLAHYEEEVKKMLAERDG